MIFSIEYDKCLEQVPVQMFIKELRERSGVDIIVISSRLSGDVLKGYNEEIKDIMFALNIPLDNLYFTNYKEKSLILSRVIKEQKEFNFNIVAHIDSSSSELRRIRERNLPIKTVATSDENWRSQINDIYSKNIKQRNEQGK